MAGVRSVLGLTVMLVAGFASFAATAQPASTSCLAVSGRPAPVIQAAFRPAAQAQDPGARSDARPLLAQAGRALEANETRLTYIQHSTFLIESAQAVRIATDYTGYAGPGVAPDVVTMNRAHETHYTDHPDPAIKHVLRGWNPEGAYAEHHLQIGDVQIRNVPTNIRGRDGGTVEFGNSIFIFEMVGLCIAHLGHLHHELTAQQLGQIGVIDVVLVPVDGSYTLDLPGVVEVLKSLHARLIVPMHYFSGFSLNRFLERMRPYYSARFADSPSVVVSRAMLPETPEILVLPPL
ncbi:MAG: MBL fold metallo-hydrolase [Hyphomicrobiales bacterium]|nr:MBL fold metallo-hydrolase [Hyphomicrobiales bacterium]